MKYHWAWYFFQLPLSQLCLPWLSSLLSAQPPRRPRRPRHGIKYKEEHQNSGSWTLSKLWLPSALFKGLQARHPAVADTFGFYNPLLLLALPHLGSVMWPHSAFLPSHRAGLSVASSPPLRAVPLHPWASRRLCVQCSPRTTTIPQHRQYSPA